MYTILYINKLLRRMTLKINESAEFYSFIRGIFKDLMNENEKSGYFITYRFLLPFRLPVTNLSTIAYKQDYIFYFINREYEHPAAEELAAHYPMRLTFVEATVRLKRKEFKQYPSGEKKRTKKDRFISEKYQDLKDILNKMIIGLSIVSKNNNIYPVSTNDLIGELAMAIYRYSNNKPLEIERHIVRTPFRSDKEEQDKQILSEVDYNEAVKKVVEEDKGNYIKIYAKLRESERLFFSEQHNDCIVSRNTAFEMFTTNIVLRYEKLIKKAGEKRLFNLSNKTPFANIIDPHLKNIIEHELKLEEATLIYALIEKFTKTCSQYRHSIVHRGEEFTIIESSESMELLDEIILLIVDNVSKIKDNAFAEEFKINHVVTKPHVLREILEKYKHLK